MILTKSQQEILNYTGNIVVKASAGTGKTHILVEKIKVKQNLSNEGDSSKKETDREKFNKLQDIMSTSEKANGVLEKII